MMKAACSDNSSNSANALIADWREASDECKAKLFDDLVGSDSRFDFLEFLKQEYASPIEQVRLAKILRRASLFSQSKPIPTKAVASYFYKASGGGIESTVMSLFKAFSGQRESYLIVDEQELLPEDLADRQDRLVPLGCSCAGDAPHYELLANAVQACGVDVLIHHAWLDPLLLWDVLACKLQGTAVVLYEYGVFSHFLNVTEGSPIAWKDGRIFAVVPAVASLCDAVMSENDVSRTFFSQFNRRAFTARHALADRFFEQPSPHVRPHEECDIVLWVGRFDAFKHADDAVRIFAQAKAVYPNMRLVLCGASYEGEQEPLLMQLAAELGVQDDVEITGFVDPLPYYQLADALISTTEIEGFCLVLAEACACAVPVVAYDLPYLPFTECDNVLWVPQGHVDDAARALAGLMGNKDQRASMGAAGVAFVKERFSGDPAECWYKVFEALERPVAGEESPVCLSAEEQDLIWSTLFFHFLRGQERTQKRTAQLEQMVRDAQAQVQDAQNQAAAAEQRARESDATVVACVQEYETSPSYRVGRAMLTVPRAVKNYLRARRS